MGGETWIKEAFADFLAIKTAKGFGTAAKPVDSKYSEPNSMTCGWQVQSDKMMNGLLTEVNPITQRAVQFELEFALHGNLGYGSWIYGKSCSILNEMFELFGGDVFFTEFTKVIVKDFQFDNLDSEQWIQVVEKVPALLRDQKVQVPEVTGKAKIIRDFFNVSCVDFLTFSYDSDTKILRVDQKPGVDQHYRVHCLDILFMDSDLQKVTKYFLTLEAKPFTEIKINFTGTGTVYLLPNYSNIGYIDFEFSSEDREFFSRNVKLMTRQA